jgi:hypothetical protein
MRWCRRLPEIEFHKQAEVCVQPELEGFEVARMLEIIVLGNQHGIRLAQPPFCFLKLSFEDHRGNRALVNIEEGDVVISDLVQKDHEFDEVCVRVPSERFLAPAEEVFRSDAMLWARA